MAKLFDFILHLDKHIEALINQFGTWTYAILFAVIFAETGLIIFPFLPGDSLLFLVGLFCNRPDSQLNVYAIFISLAIAAMLGDQVNYRIGKAVGRRLFSNPKSKIFKPSHLHATEEFYAKHGAKTVLLARFVPVVRAFAPFVAGMGDMPYNTFCAWSVSGAVLWVGVCTFAGYLLGNIPVVKQHFEIGLLVIIAFSVIPGVIEFLRHRRKKRFAREATRIVK